MKTVVAIAVALSFCTLSLAAATDVPLKPGKYAITYSMEMNGQSMGEASKAGPRCLNSADMSDPENVFSQNAYNGMGRNPQCKVTNVSSGSGKISYDLECPRSTDHVEAVVSGDSFKVTRSAKGKSARSVSVVTKVDGKRVGECSK
jgi:Protein of unknown function (DUF3617)